MKLNVFNRLAEHFSAMGIASLRYDKRGTGRSEGSFDEAGRLDLLGDAARALAFLKARPEIDSGRVVVLGHSEGSFLAPALFRLDPCAALILLAGAAGTLKDTLLWQMDRIAGDIETMKGFQGLVFRALRLGAKMRKDQAVLLERLETSEDEVIRHKGRKIRVGWFREYFAHSVEEDLPFVTCPVLAVTGSKDVQVDPSDAASIASRCGGPAESRVIQGMTHLLRKDEKALGAIQILKGYRKAGAMALDPDLLSLLAAWIPTAIGSPGAAL